MERYSVKLLFQFRVLITNCDSKFRTCEERIILFTIDNKKDIIEIAHKRGYEEEFNYINDDGNKVFYEFIGIVDICHLGIETNNDEVWYDIKTLLTPMERKEKILPSIEKLKKRIL